MFFLSHQEVEPAFVGTTVSIFEPKVVIHGGLVQSGLLADALCCLAVLMSPRGVHTCVDHLMELVLVPALDKVGDFEAVLNGVVEGGQLDCHADFPALELLDLLRDSVSDMLGVRVLRHVEVEGTVGLGSAQRLLLWGL